MFLSAFGFCLMSIAVKKVPNEVPQSWLVFSRGMVNLVLIYVWHVLEPRIQFRPPGLKILILRGIAGIFGVTSLFYGIRHLPLPMAVVLNWSSPLFVVIFSRWFLGERLRRLSLVAVVTAWLFLALMLGFGSDSSDIPALSWFAVLVGLGGAMAAGLAYTMVRAASAKVSPDTIIFFFSLVTAVVAAFWVVLEGAEFRMEWLMGVLAVGLFASMGQIAMTRGYLYAPAGIVSVMSLMNPCLAAIVGVFFFGENFAATQWLAMTGLLSSIGVVAYLQQKA